MHSDNNGFAVLALVLSSFIFGLVVGLNLGAFKYKSDAVKHGFAQYNQTNGNWEWKNEDTKRICK